MPCSRISTPEQTCKAKQGNDRRDFPVTVTIGERGEPTSQGVPQRVVHWLHSVPLHKRSFEYEIHYAVFVILSRKCLTLRKHIASMTCRQCFPTCCTVVFLLGKNKGWGRACVWGLGILSRTRLILCPLCASARKDISMVSWGFGSCWNRKLHRRKPYMGT